MNVNKYDWCYESLKQRIEGMMNKTIKIAMSDMIEKNLKENIANESHVHSLNDFAILLLSAILLVVAPVLYFMNVVPPTASVIIGLVAILNIHTWLSMMVFVTDARNNDLVFRNMAGMNLFIASYVRLTLENEYAGIVLTKEDCDKVAEKAMKMLAADWSTLSDKIEKKLIEESEVD